MSRGDGYPRWNATRCRRQKRCDWRCLQGAASTATAICVGCERPAVRPVSRLGIGEVVAVVVDGTPLSCPRGTLLIALLHANGIEVPTLCHHPMLPPAGACGVCLVEIRREDGWEAVTACDFLVTTPLTVRTATPALLEHRSAVVRRLLETAPGADTIRALSRTLGLALPPGDTQNTCIVCERCVRVASAVTGCNRFVVARENGVRRIDTLEISPETCRSCGACLAVCPTAAVQVPPLATAQADCHLCERICPEMAITSDSSGQLLIESERCKKCGLCVHICPENAFSTVAPTEE